MRVWAFRISFRKLAAVSAVLTVIIFAVTCAVVIGAAGREVLDGSTPAAREKFLLSRGIEVDAAAGREIEVTVPADFDEVYKNYEAIQAKQGFSLWHYAGLPVKCWSYPVANAPNNRRNIRANLLTYEGTVIGFDLFDASECEFLTEISEIDSKQPEF